jgi:hypothetical protein
MMKPTIHLNGTSRDELLRQLTTAGGALRKAIGALSDAAPHGRDYYPQGSSAITKATAEHVSRLSRLQSVYEELEALAEHVANVERG